MSEPKVSPRRYSRLALGMMFVAGIAFVWLLDFAIVSTNTVEFCTSCHTMSTNFKEYQETLHYRNRSGIQTSCGDCHVPKELGPKLFVKIVAAKDVYHEIVGTINTPEKFEARRWYLANMVWDRMRASDSRECRSCHELRHMDLPEQSRSARNRHAAAEDKGETCIDCHKGVAHLEPDEPEQTDPAKTPADEAS